MAQGERFNALILRPIVPSSFSCDSYHRRATVRSGGETMPVVCAAELSYTKVRALNMDRTICFQPVSALEVHGPHLPLGMDYFMAKWMAEESGRRFSEAHPEWTVVQLPPL